MTERIVHTRGGSIAMCFTRSWSTLDPVPHCASCTCEAPSNRTPDDHGTWVRCGYCGEMGILPDEGHLIDFCGPGAKPTGDAGAATLERQ